MNILPVTQARSQLGDLVDKAQLDNFFILTKGGFPKAAIVDYAYLVKLQEVVKKIFGKTYLDPKLLPYTKLFEKSEVAEWLKNDRL